jgi:hypothetical protein
MPRHLQGRPYIWRLDAEGQPYRLFTDGLEDVVDWPADEGEAPVERIDPPVENEGKAH